MSRTRHNFSAKFKSDLVLELLKGEKNLNTLASENSIQPNLLRNWKKEFLDKASCPAHQQMDWLKKSKETLRLDYKRKFRRLNPLPAEISICRK